MNLIDVLYCDEKDIAAVLMCFSIFVSGGEEVRVKR